MGAGTNFDIRWLVGFALLAAGLTPSPVTANPREKAELIRLEQDYARALVAKDLAFLDRYYAPDWTGGDWMGIASRSTIMNLLRDRRYTVRSMKLRRLDVRIVGRIGIVQGIDEELSSMHGVDTSGRWGFTDVFEKRAGRWVAIASQTTRIEPPGERRRP